MGNRVTGKVAIISGGATPIGEVISKKFAIEGAKVVVCGSCEDPVDKVVRSINESGGSAIGYIGDVSSEIKAKECITMTTNTWGKLDILINASGILPAMEKLPEYSIETFYYILRNNIQAAFMMSKFALPELKKTQGSILFSGANVGIEGMSDNAPYAGTKGFIHAFAKGLALEQKSNGVRVNCISNGPIDKEWITSSTQHAYNQKTNIDEIAEGFVYLASDEAGHLTGILYEVEGGIVNEAVITERFKPEIKTSNRPSVKNKEDKFKNKVRK